MEGTNGMLALEVADDGGLYKQGKPMADDLQTHLSAETQRHTPNTSIAHAAIKMCRTALAMQLWKNDCTFWGRHMNRARTSTDILTADN